MCILLGGYLILFSHTIKGCFIGSGAIVWLPRCKWSKPEGYDIHSSMCNIFHETCTCLLGVLFLWTYHCIYQYCSVTFQWQWNNRMKMVKTEGWHTRAKYNHDDVITSKRFLCCWHFVRGIHRSPVTSGVPYQRISNMERSCSFDVSPNKLSKHSNGRWSGMLCRSGDVSVTISCGPGV